jgi:Family of unknown function (DUF6175)
MKRILLFWGFALLITTSAWGQAKKPTIMVVPSDIYCLTKGFMAETTDQGRKRQDPDYRRAFQQDRDLRAIISGINNYMSEQDFPLIDMEATLRSLEIEDIEEEVMVDKAGDELAESLLDKVKRRAKADIILDLDFNISNRGPEKIMTFNLKALDAYTNVNFAGVEGAGRPSVNTNIEILLREDNYTRMAEFNASLTKHFERLFKEGREVKIDIRLTTEAPVDFETEYGDLELNEVIDNWFAENAFKEPGKTNARYSVGDMSDVRMPIVAKIPLFNENGKAIDTREFAQQLRKFLKAAPYNISATIRPRGLGQAYVLIGKPRQ